MIKLSEFTYADPSSGTIVVDVDSYLKTDKGIAELKSIEKHFHEIRNNQKDSKIPRS